MRRSLSGRRQPPLRGTGVPAMDGDPTSCNYEARVMGTQGDDEDDLEEERIEVFGNTASPLRDLSQPEPHDDGTGADGNGAPSGSSASNKSPAIGGLQCMTQQNWAQLVGAGGYGYRLDSERILLLIHLLAGDGSRLLPRLLGNDDVRQWVQQAARSLSPAPLSGKLVLALLP
ncbi:hypothetical protein OsI_03939 [Oryza sativa Indica Group]|uniref:Uncharacterized protein n=1 Tax=Oryza sativa subsp. indica TaxID=39946 RepID=A2WVL8_ORYSI|nr:hypothetical protein OsI_03939 [Oryza sativa Indica Group]